MEAAKPHNLEHWVVQIGSMNFNMDTLIYEALVMGIIMILALVVRSRLNTDNPGKLQVMIEGLFDFLGNLVRDSLGDYGRKVIPPLTLTLFLFILFANWIELIPGFIPLPAGHGGEIELVPFKAPTSDINVPLALGILVILIVHFFSVKAKGPAGYLVSYFNEPLTRDGLGIPKNIWIFVVPFVFAFNFILRFAEELGKLISLPMRLFGNIFAGGILFFLIALLPVYALPFPDIFWRGWSTLVGLIQAFVFGLLAIVYTKLATTHHETDEKGGAH